jgi:phage repressor protein C with HTH and peptisase S24 domain
MALNVIPLDGFGMSVGDRIAERLSACDLSQSELARRVGLGQSTINGLVRGDSRSSAHLHKIAAALSTTVEYLTGETDDPMPRGSGSVSTEALLNQLDLVPIKSIDMAYGMGATFTDNPIDVQVRYFPRSWVEELTSTPSALLTWGRGRGNSMAPTINDNDIVLIDLSDKRVQDQDLIWAFTIGDIGMIKRLRVRGRNVTILSDNDAVPPDHADAEEINIIGRITHIVRRL